MDSILNLFPNKVIVHECHGFEQIKEPLIDFIYKEREKNPYSFEYTVVNGWQSALDYHTHPDFQVFMPFITKHIEFCFEIYGFDTSKCFYEICTIALNINTPRSYQNSHIHAGAHMAGTMWIKAPKNSGNLAFVNPSIFSQSTMIHNLSIPTVMNDNMQHTYHMEPQEGHILMFPPGLQHGVAMNLSDEDRISIAYNILIHKK